MNFLRTPPTRKSKALRKPDGTLIPILKEDDVYPGCPESDKVCPILLLSCLVFLTSRSWQGKTCLWQFFFWVCSDWILMLWNHPSRKLLLWCLSKFSLRKLCSEKSFLCGAESTFKQFLYYVDMPKEEEPVDVPETGIFFPRIMLLRDINFCC